MTKLSGEEWVAKHTRRHSLTGVEWVCFIAIIVLASYGILIAIEQLVTR